MSELDVLVSAHCRKCGEPVDFFVNSADLTAWQNGALVQQAMPYLGSDKREFLISRVCGKCFDRITEQKEQP